MSLSGEFRSFGGDTFEVSARYEFHPQATTAQSIQGDRAERNSPDTLVDRVVVYRCSFQTAKDPSPLPLSIPGKTTDPTLVAHSHNHWRVSIRAPQAIPGAQADAVPPAPRAAAPSKAHLTAPRVPTAPAAAPLPPTAAAPSTAHLTVPTAPAAVYDSGSDTSVGSVRIESVCSESEMHCFSRTPQSPRTPKVPGTHHVDLVAACHPQHPHPVYLPTPSPSIPW